MVEKVEKTDDLLGKLVEGLTQRLRRAPTEDEVMQFIYGTNEERLAILKEDGDG